MLAVAVATGMQPLWMPTAVSWRKAAGERRKQPESRGSDLHLHGEHSQHFENSLQQGEVELQPDNSRIKVVNVSI